MSDTPRELLRALSKRLENNGTVEKVVAVECQNVLDNVVLPTIRMVREEIKSKRVIVREESLAILVVHKDGNGHDELVFECDGRVLYAIAKMEDKQESIMIAQNLDAVSTTSVAKTIENFLEQRLKPLRGQ